MEVPTKPGKISEYSARPIHGRSVGRFSTSVTPRSSCTAAPASTAATIPGSGSSAWPGNTAGVGPVGCTWRVQGDAEKFQGSFKTLRRRFKEDGGIAPLARCSADHPLRRGLREHRIVSVIDSPRPPRYCPVSVRPARYLEDQHARDPCPHESPLAGMDVGRGVRANGLTCPKSEECLSSRV